MTPEEEKRREEEEYSEIERALWRSHEDGLRNALLDAGHNKFAAGIVVAIASMQGPATWETLKDTLDHKMYLDYIHPFGRSSVALTQEEIQRMKAELVMLKNEGVIVKRERGYQLAPTEAAILGLRNISQRLTNNVEDRIRKHLSYMERTLLDRGWVVDGIDLRQIDQAIIGRKRSHISLPIKGLKHIADQEELRKITTDILRKAGTKSKPGKIHVVTEYGTWLTKEPNKTLVEQKAKEGAEIIAILVERPEDPAGKAWDRNVSILRKIPCSIFCVEPEEHNHHMTLIDDYYAIYFHRRGLSLALIPFYTDSENHPNDIAWLKRKFDNLLGKAESLS